MKCIKAIKETKYSKIGDIKRISDLDADENVSTGYWMFVPKSEWKTHNKSNVVETTNENDKSLKKNQKTKTLDKKSKNSKKK